MFHQTLHVDNFESAPRVRQGKTIGANGNLLVLIGSGERTLSRTNNRVNE